MIKNQQNQDYQLPEEGVFSFEDILKESSEEIHDVGIEAGKEDEIKGVPEEEEESEEKSEEKVEEKPEEKEVSEEDSDTAKAKESKGDTEVNIFTKRTREYIENGRWQDATVEIDGEQVPISELGEIDEELFFQLDEAQENLRKEELSTKYINLDELDDTTKRLNEISKAGGDITQLIKTYDEFVHPLKDLDLEDPKIQEAIVRNDLSRLKLDPTIIDLTVEKYKKDLVLDTKAGAIVDNVNTAFNSLLDQRKQEAAEKTKSKAEALKQYKASLETNYKTNDIDDKEIKKMVAFATGVDKNGEKAVQKAFEEAITDPETAQDLIFFLHNKEGFLKFKGAKADRKEKINTLREIHLVPRGAAKGKTAGGKSKEYDGGFNFVEMGKK